MVKKNMVYFLLVARTDVYRTKEYTRLVKHTELM